MRRYDATLQVRTTIDQVQELNRLSRTADVGRAWLIRELLALGLAEAAARPQDLSALHEQYVEEMLEERDRDAANA